MEKDNLIKAAGEFFVKFPNASKIEFSKFVRKREMEELKKKLNKQNQKPN